MRFLYHLSVFVKNEEAELCCDFHLGSILKESQLIRDELFFSLQIDQICFNQANSISLFLFLILREHLSLMQVCLNYMVPQGTYLSSWKNTLIASSRNLPWPKPDQKNVFWIVWVFWGSWLSALLGRYPLIIINIFSIVLEMDWDGLPSWRHLCNRTSLCKYLCFV